MSDELKKIPVPKSKDFKLDSITNVNYKPHPYCITPEHLETADMYLNETSIREAEKNGVRCGMYVKGDKYCNHPESGYTRCDVPYDEHKSDKVLFIKALVDKEIKDLSGLESYLKKIKHMLEELGIDGIAFIASK